MGGWRASGVLPLLMAAMVALCASPALAQSARAESAVPSPQELNPAQAAPKPSHSNDIFAAPEPGPCPLRDSKLTFVLKSVEFTGAEGVRPRRLVASYDGLIGQRVAIWTVCDIRDRAAALLFSAGILARVEIPSQTIADGKLKLEVIEARIANVRFHGDAGPAQSKIEGYIEHLRGLVPFDLEVAQRYLLLAADVPGVQISAAIRPSPEGRGSVDLDITATRKLVDASVNVENFASHTLGPWAGLGRIDLNGLTSLGDRTSVVFYSTTDGREQQVAQLIEEIRPGDQGLLLQASMSYSMTHPGGALSNLRLNGDAIDAIFSATYPFVRRQHLNLSAVVGLEYVDEHTNYSTGGALVDDRLRVFFARGQADLRGRTLGMPWQGGAEVELRQGVDIFAASRPGQPGLSHNGADPESLVERLDGHLSVRPLPLLEFYIAAAAQNADKPLLTFEQLAIGNLTFGRGYDPSSVAGDRGVAGSSEVRLGPVSPIKGLLISTYGFFDAGYVKYLDQVGQATTVRSTGGGVRLNYKSLFDLDLMYADPLDRISLTTSKPPPARVLVTLSAHY